MKLRLMMAILLGWLCVDCSGGSDEKLMKKLYHGRLDNTFILPIEKYQISLGDLPVSADDDDQRKNTLSGISTQYGIYSAVAELEAGDKRIVAARFALKNSHLAIERALLEIKGTEIKKEIDVLGLIKDRKTNEINEINYKIHKINCKVTHLQETILKLTKESDYLTGLTDDIQLDIDEITERQDLLTIKTDKIALKSDKLSLYSEKLGDEINKILADSSINDRDSFMANVYSLYYNQQATQNPNQVLKPVSDKKKKKG